MQEPALYNLKTPRGVIVARVLMHLLLLLTSLIFTWSSVLWTNHTSNSLEELHNAKFGWPLRFATQDYWDDSRIVNFPYHRRALLGMGGSESVFFDLPLFGLCVVINYMLLASVLYGSVVVVRKGCELVRDA